MRDRLHEQSLEAGGPTLVDAWNNRMVRQTNEPRPAPVRIPGELSRKLKAAAIRQIEVEEDEVRQEMLCHRNGSSGRSD